MSLDLASLLNTEQHEAASTIHGPLLIIAGAGSGKTRMICHRIAHMLERGIGQQQILALTFTNKAATEMAQRVRELTGSPLPDLVTSTFHAFGLRVLKKQCHLLGYRQNFTIYDSSDRASLLREVMLEEQLDPQAFDSEAVLQLFSDIKTERSGWPDDAPKTFKTLYDAYREHMRLYNAFDFDDLLMLPLTIFDRYPQVLEEYRTHHTHIMVDEFQDTSLEQYRLVQLLAAKSRNLCVVGDDDQSIYSWRGANYRNIMRFEQDFPERKEIKLERNYRSTGTILEAANTLITHNTERKEKALWTDSGKGGLILQLRPEDEEVEIMTVIRKMRNISYERQVGWDAFGILVRTNHLIPFIENKLMLENIPCSVSGGQSFFERKEVKDTLAYLRLLVNPDDDIAFLRVVNTPRRGMGRSTLLQLRQVAERQHVSLSRSLQLVLEHDNDRKGKQYLTMGRFHDLMETYRQALWAAGTRKSSILRSLMEEIGYRNHLLAEFPGNEDAVMWRYKSIETFLALFSRWEQDPDHRDQSIHEYLHMISLAGRERKDDEDKVPKVALMTMHASKGLEFDTVFLLAIEDHVIPHARTLEENPDAIEEERRLFYVAITRARKLLCISSCQQRKRGREMVASQPSRFLSEIPAQLFEDEGENRELESDETFSALARLRDMLAEKQNPKVV